jgi:hypothetical protein
MILTNTSNITRIGLTEHIKNKAEAITGAEVFGEALEATVAVFVEVEAAADMSY